MPKAEIVDKKLLVFLSHASEDKSAVRRLSKRLKDDGFDPWLDDERLLPGQNWELEIEEALRKSDVILLCFSEQSVGKEGFVQREFKRARKYQEEKPEGTIFTIPVRFDQCEIPFSYRELQWVDFPANYHKLVSALESRSAKLSNKPKMSKSSHSTLPSSPKAQTSNIFICYRRNIDVDRILAEFLYDYFKVQGHEPFIDTSMRVGTDWLKEIDRRIEESDFMVVLLSRESADSEMIQAEVRRAAEFRQLQGRPKVLPVKINYEGLLPYSIDAFIENLQWIAWQEAADNEYIAREILAVIESGEVSPAQIGKSSTVWVFSEDGRPVKNNEVVTPPLPEFDPRILDELIVPGGTVSLKDKFYVERDADAKYKNEIGKSGSTISIRASRQTGKSSLLVRGVHHVSEISKTIHIDLQRVDHSFLRDSESWLRYLSTLIARKLGIKQEVVKEEWSSELGPQDKLTALFDNHILPTIDRTLVLAIDEADRLLETSFSNDFFALLRAWHNNRPLDEAWDKLNIVLVIATEPYLLISDPNQSPFNVGLRLDLEDFNRSQVQELNQRHGAPVREIDIDSFFNLLSGHPYLTRKALYTLVADKMSLHELFSRATDDQGTFGDHLRRQHWLLRNDKALRENLLQIIQRNTCDDEAVLFRLLRAGLVKGKGKAYYCRCSLYEQYFKDKLL
jgi:hypothetical protein